MSSMNTVLSLAVLGAVLAVGARAQRQFGLEADDAARRAIESAVRASAVDYNPNVDLTVPELHDFELVAMQVTTPRILALLGVSDSYDVYVRFRESGSERCMGLSLEWIPRTESWKAVHSGMDRCQPIW